MIGNECLSSTIIQQALSSEYYHLREGWIRSKDLKEAINKQIIENPDSSMRITILDQHQILHKGDNDLNKKWQDILITNNIQWYTGGTKTSIASAHLGFLTLWGIDGGICGGFEAFMAYGLPYLIQFLKAHEIKPVILLDSEYKASIDSIIKNIPILDQSSTEAYTYNHLSDCKLDNPCISIVIEPPKTVSEKIYKILNACDLCFFFPKKTVNQFTPEEKDFMSHLLGNKQAEDLYYQIRNVNESLSAPASTVFPENLHLATSPLIFHENTINLK